MADDKQAVLNTLLSQTNDVQGEWTTRRALRTSVVAHGQVTPTGFETAVGILLDEDLLEERGDELRPTEEARRIPHRGELGH